ncbi:hypothetical protein J5Y03_14100 [Bacillus sp. RG28]|uniref:Uncharacterized protein n=1 Tax=Gottfriedia endophytica TaxID=2820819 RepID=A0A940SKR2_9BACI|nr:hypothetical protein [Gottfriedia endophytica]MBP0726289.1 hypothetical protein [Gottfriedia endophytica]
MKSILLVLSLLTIVGSSNEHINKTMNRQTKISSINQITKIHIPTSTSTKNNITQSKPIKNNGKWVQLGAKLYYLQGSVKKIERNKNGQYILKIVVEKTFHSKSDGVKSPYKNGETYSFLLKSLPNINLKQKNIIIYGGQVTSNGHDSFMGTKIVCYELNKTFVDLHGKIVLLPQKEYPYQF